MLKISLIFKKNAIFSGKQLKIYLDLECEVFKIWFFNRTERMGRLSNLHECTFKWKIVKWMTVYLKDFLEYTKTKKHDMSGG